MPSIPALAPAPSDGVVALREWRDADVPAITVACQDPGIQRWTMVPAAYSEDDARAFVARARTRLEGGDAAELAVVDAARERGARRTPRRKRWPNAPGTRGRASCDPSTAQSTDWSTW